MKRKGLALLLVLCFVVTLLPVVASAAGNSTDVYIGVDDSITTPFLVVKGGHVAVHATTDFNNGKYYWEEVSNEGILEVRSDDAGENLWLVALKEGTATFKLIDGDESTSFSIRVLTDKQGVSISPETIVVAKGETKKVKATYTSGTTDITTPPFTWHSKNQSIATVQADEDDSSYGIIKGEAIGETRISANTTRDGGHYEECVVSVEKPFDITYKTNDNGKVKGDKSAVRTDVVTVTAEPKDNYKVSSITVINDKTGEVIEPIWKSEKSLDFEMPESSVTVSAEYSIIDESKKPLKGIKLDEEKAEVPVKASFALGVTLDPEDATDYKLKDAKWESKNESIATVEDGIVTGVKQGKAKIEVSLGGFSKVCEVTVTPALNKVEASKQELTIANGREETLGVTYKTSNNDHLIAKWISEDPSIATVDRETGKVTGRKVGETKITVTVGEESDTVKVTVIKSEGEFRVAVDTSIKNGKVTSDKEYADKGDTVKLSVVPDDGYKLAEISATTVKEDDTDGEAVSVKGSGSSYSFVMPEANVVVQAKFEKTSTSRFVDVPSGIWYEEAVNYVADKGYLDGVGNNRFDPNGRVTRGQLCTILYAMEGKPLVTAGSVFPDVAASKYYYDPVRWAATNGMVAGYTDGTFKPEVYVSRQQLAAVLHKYTAYKGFDTSVTANIKTFADYSSVSNYAVTPLSWAVSHKVMSGTNTNRLEPLNAATRAEFAVMLKAYDANVRK